jgi:hypothetical protein
MLVGRKYVVDGRQYCIRMSGRNTITFAISKPGDGKPVKLHSASANASLT